MRRLSHAAAVVAVAAAAAFVLSRPPVPAGHRLVGSWETPPGAIGPQALTFGPDGAGMDAGGVGNFPFRWRVRSDHGGVSRVRVRYTGDAVGARGERVASGTRSEDVSTWTGTSSSSERMRSGSTAGNWPAGNGQVVRDLSRT